MLESISYDGEVYIVALLSADSGPESCSPHRIHRARGLLACLRDSKAKLLFRTVSAEQFDPPGSIARRFGPPPRASAVL